MTILNLLLNRYSHSSLSEPAPTTEDVKMMISAALRVPDHARLKPFHFYIYSGDGRKKLSNAFVHAARAKTPDCNEDFINKISQSPFRAPMIIVATNKIQQHKKVPEIEQKLTVGCSIYAIQLAAQALGYGSIWRTGDMAYNTIVKSLLGLEGNEQISGFIYLGTPDKSVSRKPMLNYEDYINVVDCY
jgi:nitroreductase